MKEVILEIAGLAARDPRYSEHMRLYEERARQARAQVLRAAFARPARAVVAWFRRQHDRHLDRVAMRELQALDDRLLRDLGINRADIPQVVRALRGRDASSSGPAPAISVAAPPKQPAVAAARSPRTWRDAA